MKNTLRQFVRGAAIAAFMAGLQGCASPAPEKPPSATIGVRATRTAPANPQCSMRLQINLSPAASMTRIDQDLDDIGRNLGVTLDVVQSMGRNRLVVNMRGDGSQRVCEDAYDQLRMDIRIESVQRY